MWLILLEAGLALGLFLFIIWWTMFHGRPKEGAAPPRLDPPREPAADAPRAASPDDPSAAPHRPGPPPGAGPQGPG